MNQSPFTMMLSSGVIRSGDLEVRRAMEFNSLHVARRLPEFLNSLLDVPMEAESRSSHMKKRDALKRPYAAAHVFSAPFSLRAVADWLGLFNRSEQPTKPKFVSSQKTIGILEEKVRVLTSLLKAEQIRFQSQQVELHQLRNEVKRIEQLQAELTVERVSGKLLVEWLQELEQQLFEIRDGSGSQDGPAGFQQTATGNGSER